MAAPTTNYASGVFLGQKRSKSGSELDPDLETQGEFVKGDSDDPDKESDVEALGGRHRRGFGYTSEGALEHDIKKEREGGHPQRVSMHKSPVPESRIANFTHGVTHHRELTTGQIRKRPTTI